jgi:hypothetical protein
MRGTPHRIALTENQARPVLSEAAAETGQTPYFVAAALSETSRRLAKLHHLENQPITIDGDSVKVDGLAGLIRVQPGLELEVAPKFLGHALPGWREDFFRIANLTSGGRILAFEEIAAGRGESNDLASLVGRVMVNLFKNEQRRPIRLYRRRRWEDFEVDGDVDDESVFLPAEDGFSQEKVVLERSNPFNSVIAEAARLLVLEVEDQDVRRQLQRMYGQLSPQPPLTRVAALPYRVPSRHRRWQQLYDISRRVVEGFGMNFEEREAPAPGFTMRTWPSWEQLIYLALHSALTDPQVVEDHRGYRFGTRNGESFSVTPDGTVSSVGADFLWDAKYKAQMNKGVRRVSSADVYEAHAFLSAAQVGRIALLYPRLARDPQVACGKTEVFERVELESGTIWALSVEVRGIAAKAGFKTFATNLAEGVRQEAGTPLTVAA